jgi:hypothetical protein
MLDLPSRSLLVADAITPRDTMTNPSPRRHRTTGMGIAPSRVHGCPNLQMLLGFDRAIGCRSAASILRARNPCRRRLAGLRQLSL